MGMRPSGFFKEIGDSFAEVPSKEGLELIYESPRGHSILYKGSIGERIVALKCLKPSFRGDSTYEAILRHEYEITSQLKHPGICDCLGWINTGGLGNCLVLEWVEGITLEEFLSKGEADGKTALSISAQLCDALAYIHKKQVIHNDLKPENIMLASEGNVVKIIDFSLADSPSMTTGHLPAGTEGFAAPEVVDGGKPSVRSDIYSLGKVLSLLLPSRSNAWGKCLEIDPSKRYSSTEEVKAAFEARKSGIGRTILMAVLAAAILVALSMSLWPKADVQEESDIFLDAIALTKERIARPPGTDASKFNLADTVDCLNGKYIVTSDGRKGILDSSGRLLVEPAWDDIEFLSVDVALLSKGSFFQLCGPDGRIFAESVDKEGLIDTYQSQYERSLFEDMRRWDEVVSRLDSLFSSCLSNELSEEIPVRFDSFRRSLEAASGNISKNQALRISEIEERYNEHSGR